MLKKLKICTAVMTSFFLAGCATPFPVGGLYTDVTLPLHATSESGGSKQGTSECSSILGLISSGDCSIEAAKVNGGLTVVTHADWKANNILGIIGKYTLTVYGE